MSDPETGATLALDDLALKSNSDAGLAFGASCTNPVVDIAKGVDVDRNTRVALDSANKGRLALSTSNDCALVRTSNAVSLKKDSELTVLLSPSSSTFGGFRGSTCLIVRGNGLILVTATSGSGGCTHLTSAFGSETKTRLL